jgi:hypothetical protein
MVFLTVVYAYRTTHKFQEGTATGYSSNLVSRKRLVNRYFHGCLHGRRSIDQSESESIGVRKRCSPAILQSKTKKHGVNSMIRGTLNG